MDYIKDEGVEIDPIYFEHDFDEADEIIREEVDKEYADQSDDDMAEKFGYNKEP